MKEPFQAKEPAEPDENSSPQKRPVTVPGVIVDFLERATIGAAGTRDADHVPHLHKLSGWRVEPEHRAMTCLIPEAFTGNLLRSLEDNGRLAVTIEEIGPHETYQFKGRYSGSRSCDEEDRHVHRRLRDRFGKVLSKMFGFDEQACRDYVQEPSIAITFEVEEIFLQTPGPGAGRRLAPPEQR